MAENELGDGHEAAVAAKAVAVRNTTNNKKNYKKILIMLMSYLDNTHYEDDVQFTTEQLCAITPMDIVRWMNFRTYGLEDPPKEQLLANNRYVLPPKVRSNTLQYWKKALSSYMPHKNKPWDVVTHEGNPTRTHHINEVIQLVKRKEDLANMTAVNMDPKVFYPAEERPPTVAEAAAAKHIKNGGVGPVKVSIQDQINGLQEQLQTMQDSIRMLLARQDEGREIATKQYVSLSAQIRQVSAAHTQQTQLSQKMQSTSTTSTSGSSSDKSNKKNHLGEAMISGISPNATLVSNPRTLGMLWEEYIHGVGGRKPAKDFNAMERGKVKHKYHRRNIVWKLIGNLVRAGHTAEVAIDMIYKVYGPHQTVTAITTKLKRDILEDKLDPTLKI